MIERSVSIDLFERVAIPARTINEKETHGAGGGVLEEFQELLFSEDSRSICQTGMDRKNRSDHPKQKDEEQG